MRPGGGGGGVGGMGGSGRGANGTTVATTTQGAAGTTTAESSTAAMERALYYRLHATVSSAALRHTTASTRSLVEHVALFLAVCSFTVVILAHERFVYYTASSAREGGGRRGSYERGDSYVPSSCLRSIPGFDADGHEVVNIVLRHDGDDDDEEDDDEEDDDEGHHPWVETATGGDGRRSFVLARAISSMTTADSAAATVTTCSPASIIDDDRDELVYSYSRNKGFLLLPPSALDRYNVSTQTVIVSTSDSKCFGESLLQFLVQSFLGSDTIVLNWLLALHDGEGYAYRTATKELFDLGGFAPSDYDSSSPVSPRSPFFFSHRIEEGSNHEKRGGKRHDGSHGNSNGNGRGQNRFLLALHLKLGIVAADAILFGLTTSLVTFTLRETQGRMVAFAVLLQSRVRDRAPIGTLVFAHAAEILFVFVPITVGSVLFLSIDEVYGDRFLASAVLGMVWICEVFNVVGARTLASIRFFPRVFFLYFTLFHVYFFSCPFGFTYTSLVSTVLFLVHAMMFFWNRYELPALQLGAVSPSIPRMVAGPSRLRDLEPRSSTDSWISSATARR